MTSNKLRFFVTGQLKPGLEFELEEKASHKIRSVLRLKKGNEIFVFNCSGLEFRASVMEIKKKSVTVRTAEQLTTVVESPFGITLIIAIIKADKMDYALQKATELGVTNISPIFSTRTVIKINEKRQEKRQIHWQNVLQTATEQCGRRKIPTLLPTRALDEIVISNTESQYLILDPRAQKKMNDLEIHDKSIALFCGPEGGFTDNEVGKLLEQGVKNVSLGPRILRTETASTSALVIAQSVWGDMKN